MLPAAAPCCTQLAARIETNPAVTSAPLMTTIVDSSGLIIYFLVAKLVLKLDE